MTLVSGDMTLGEMTFGRLDRKAAQGQMMLECLQERSAIVAFGVKILKQVTKGKSIQNLA